MAANLERAESALIVPVELPAPIRRLRDGLDPAAGAGVPPHITLLYPFVPPDLLDEDVNANLRAIVASEHAFTFALTTVARWPNVVYLVPEPSQPFRQLTRAVVAAYPNHPPYGGAHSLEDLVPHLTIAHSDRADYLDAAAHALPALLPVRAVCREATLIAHAPRQRWRTLSQFALSAETRKPAG